MRLEFSRMSTVDMLEISVLIESKIALEAEVPDECLVSLLFFIMIRN